MPRDVRDLADLPPMPLPQEEGLEWFKLQAELAPKDYMGVIPNEEFGAILAFKGASLDEASHVSVIDRHGNFLDPNDHPNEARVVLRHSEYKDRLAARLAERNSNN